MTKLKSLHETLCKGYLQLRRRDSLVDIEKGPPLEQISDETGTLLHILKPLNPDFYRTSGFKIRDHSPTFMQGRASTPVRAGPSYISHECQCFEGCREDAVTLSPIAEPQQYSSPHRSPRRATHYVREGYICECGPHCQGNGSSVDKASCSSAESAGSLVYAALSPSVDNVESPLFDAENESVEIPWKRRSRRGRWSPYPSSR
jgi:hypothetical protein